MKKIKKYWWLIILLIASALLIIVAITPSAKSKARTDVKFSCENDDKKVEKRGYILLMGLADHHKEGWIVEKSLMEQDSKAAFAVVYDQDERLHLKEVSKKFVADVDALLKKYPVDELVLFGSSAGGVTAAHAIAEISKKYPEKKFSLHTLSSPLKGYGFAALGKERRGFFGDITAGILPFGSPGKNVSAYHHKTVTDSVLKDYYCGSFAGLCDPVKIQNNNLANSKEFYYPQYDHNPLMRAVIRTVLRCYNSKLVFDQSPAAHSGLGELCMNESECNIFCKDNFGLCKKYCASHSANPICQKPFSFQAMEQNSDEPPVTLKNIGVNLDYYDPITGKAGDLVFTKEKLQFGVLFTEFGFTIPANMSASGKAKQNPQPTFELPLGTKVHSLIDGVVIDVPKLYSNDYSIMVGTDPKSRWRYETEHVIDPLVKPGDIVKAGQVIAKVSPHNMQGNSGYGLVEIGILKGGNPPQHVCPFAYLDSSIKDEVQKKLLALYKAWEEYRNDSNLYDEKAQPIPGCLIQGLING